MSKNDKKSCPRYFLAHGQLRFLIWKIRSSLLTMQTDENRINGSIMNSFDLCWTNKIQCQTGHMTYFWPMTNFLCIYLWSRIHIYIIHGSVTSSPFLKYVSIFINQYLMLDFCQSLFNPFHKFHWKLVSRVILVFKNTFA